MTVNGSKVSKVLRVDMAKQAMFEQSSRLAASEIVKAAEVRSHDIEETYRQKGFAQGRADGQKQWLTMIADFSRQVEAVSDELEDRISKTVLSAVRRIIGDIPASVLAEKCIRVALEENGFSRKVVLAIHPENQALVESILISLPGHSLIVQIDPLLDPGEFVVESIVGRTHIGSTSQTNRLAMALAVSS